MTHDVFISHSSKDKLTADAICHALEQNGVRCWIAPRDVKAGANYGAEIAQGIRVSKLLLLIFSSSSNISPAVHKEVETAFRHNKIIVPYRFEKVKISDGLDFYIAGNHWLDAYSKDTAFSDLVVNIKKLLGMSTEKVAEEKKERKGFLNWFSLKKKEQTLSNAPENQRSIPVAAVEIKPTETIEIEPAPNLAPEPENITSEMEINAPAVAVEPQKLIQAPVLNTEIPADADVFVPSGIVTIKMEDGTIKKGIANSVLFQNTRTYFEASSDTKILTKDIISIEVEPMSMGEAKITTVQGENYEVEFESHHEMSFKSAESPFLKEKIKCLQIQSVVFNRMSMPEINLEYMLIEQKTGKSYVTPVEFARFQYFAWHHIRNIPGRYTEFQPCSYYSSMPILLEDFKIPSNEIVIPNDEIASLRFKLVGRVDGVGSIWYQINVYKKNGNIISAKTQADMSLTIHYLTKDDMAESNVSDIKRITFLN